ncbi:phage virion morphogenesis protein [Cognaticolwellia mytili]|uniref:phage virion morphogenesis protein n=1 Tax=Cognaticolwellia mytili TaxID=1888913 RepID=UPI001301B716|nr:phage virion morphogenesis protein [Cognaticolwellia mytili]
MSGSFIKVDVKGISHISKAISRAIKKGQDLTPALQDIGEYLVESTQRRFIDMQAPDGTPWAPLHNETLAKKKRPDRILTEEGNLADLINYQLNGDDLAIGTPLEYGATHQFGRLEAGIEARPFLGIAPFERAEIREILRDHLIIE